MADLKLIGYRFSVYTRIVRMTLIETGLQAGYVEADPFADPPDPGLLAVNPFGRVPVLRDGPFVLTETAAITRYLDELTARPSLVPETVRPGARMAQVIGVVDAYGDWPLVRQVFSHGFFRPHQGLVGDPDIVGAGLAGAKPVLRVLDGIAAEGWQLSGDRISLADLHLAPMIACFTMVPQGRDALAGHPALSHWWANLATRPSLTDTDPFAG